MISRSVLFFGAALSFVGLGLIQYSRCHAAPLPSAPPPRFVLQYVDCGNHVAVVVTDTKTGAEYLGVRDYGLVELKK